MAEISKVALFTNEFPPHVYGGAGVHVEYLSRELAKLVPVDKRRFMFMIQQTPFFALQVMQLMAERIRTFDDNVK